MKRVQDSDPLWGLCAMSNKNGNMENLTLRLLSIVKTKESVADCNHGASSPVDASESP